jgi:hypothetical protein
MAHYTSHISTGELFNKKRNEYGSCLYKIKKRQRKLRQQHQPSFLTEDNNFEDQSNEKNVLTLLVMAVTALTILGIYKHCKEKKATY